MAAMPFTRPRHWLRWLLAAVAGLVVLAAAGPFVYIHFFNSTPAALSLSPGSTPASTSDGASNGNTARPGPFPSLMTGKFCAGQTPLARESREGATRI